MTITPLTQSQLRRWNRWLYASHGLPQLANHTIYYCDIEFPMYLTPWTTLDGFALRQERDTGQLLVTLDLAPGNRTIANLWAGLTIRHTDFGSRMAFHKAKDDLVAAARDSRLWWGTETLASKPYFTSICYWFPPRFPFPAYIPSIPTTHL